MTTKRYDAYRCKSCNGTGSKYDITNADKVSTGGSGRTGCDPCVGRGVIWIIAGNNPRASGNWAFLGIRLSDRDLVVG